MVAILHRLDLSAVQPTLAAMPRLVSVREHHVFGENALRQFGQCTCAISLALRARAHVLLACIRHDPLRSSRSASNAKWSRMVQEGAITPCASWRAACGLALRCRAAQGAPTQPSTTLVDYRRAALASSWT